MKKFLEALKETEYVQLNNIYALINEDAYDELRSILDEEKIHYECAENSYDGIYIIKVDEKVKVIKGE